MEYTITRINDNDELIHYGVPGMKWGHRKAIVSTSKPKMPGMVKGGPSKPKMPGMVKGGPTNPRPVSMKDIKNRYKEAKKRADNAYTKAGEAYDKATKGNTIRNKKADDALDRAADKWIADRKSAKTEFKQAKKERKDSIKSTYKDIKKQSSIGDKILYNDATRRKAAKYVVDNKMSVQDARKKANKETIRNTAAFMAAYGAVAIGVYRSMK